MRNKTVRRLLTALGVAVFWLVTWQLAAMAVGQELLLPTPLSVAARLWSLLGKGVFWHHVGASLLRVAVGFTAGLFAGAALAVATSCSAVCRTLAAPVLRILRTAPVASFIILFMVWFKSAVLPVAIVFAMVTPLVWENVAKGIAETDKNLLEMARVYRFGFFKTLWRVRLPSVRPYLLSACTTGLGFAWKSGVAAEVLCLPQFAVGTALKEAKSDIETPEVLAWTVTVVLLSVAMEWLLKKLTQGRGRGRWVSE